MRRKGFTMLEVIVAATIIAAVITATMSAVPKVIESMRREQKTATYVQDGRNITEVLMARGLDRLIEACNGKNPCESNNSNINSLLPELQSGLGANNVHVKIDFYDGNGNMVSDLDKATLGLATVTLQRPNDQEPITFQTSIAADYGPNSAYGVAVRGNIRHQQNNTNLPDVKVTLTSADAVATSYIDNTDSSGDYRIVGVQPGYYNVKMEKDYFYDRELSNVLVRDNPTYINQTLQEKEFDLILSEHFTSTSNLVTLSNAEISNSRLHLAIYPELVADNPRFAAHQAQSNIARNGNYAELASTFVNGNWLLASNDSTANYFYGSSSSCRSSVDTGWMNGTQITYNNEYYTTGYVRVQPGWRNRERWVPLVCTAGWGNFDYWFRVTRNGVIIINSDRYRSPTGEGWHGELSSANIPLSFGTITIQSQGRTKLTGLSPGLVGGRSRNLRLYGSQRREYVSSGWVYQDHDLGRPVDRIRVNWDATVPSGTSLTFQAILYRDGGQVINLPKDTWVMLPKSVRYIRIRANFSSTNWQRSPQLRNYSLYIPGYRSSGYAITKDYPAPDGPDTDQVILRVTGVETQAYQAGQPAIVCEVVSGAERNCQTFDDNLASGSAWPGLLLTLKNTGTTTINVTPIYKFNDHEVENSHYNSNIERTRYFDVNYPQTIYLDYKLDAHSSVFKYKCARVEVINPSGVVRFSREVCGQHGFNPRNGYASGNVAINVSENELGQWRLYIKIWNGGGLTTAYGKVKYKSRVFDRWDIKVGNTNILTVGTIGELSEISKTVRVKQLYIPRQSETSITYQVSNDGGATWVNITPDVITKMPKPGLNYRVRINLHGAADATPRIDQIRLEGRSP